MDKIYAVVVSPQLDPDSPICRYINYLRPYAVEKGDEWETRVSLSMDFPGSWIVIAPKGFLLAGGFDLCDEDFDNCLDVRLAPAPDNLNAEHKT